VDFGAGCFYNQGVEQMSDVVKENEVDEQENTEGEGTEDELDATENETEEGKFERVDEEDDEEEEGGSFGTWDSSIAAKRFKVLLYGVAGTGKTTMAATFPKPLFLDLEGGMLSTRRVGPVLRYPKNPSEDIKSYPQVVDFYNAIVADKNPQFETIVIDSLNELQLLVTSYVVGKFRKVTRQYDDQMTLADYGKANRDFAKVVRLFLKLPYHVVFTAASSQKEFGDEGALQIAPKFVGKQVGPDVQRMMDMIGYCFAKRMPNGTSEHYVSFRMTADYLAKDRLGIVDRDIPNSFDALMENMKGK